MKKCNRLCIKLAVVVVIIGGLIYYSKESKSAVDTSTRENVITFASNARFGLSAEQELSKINSRDTFVFSTEEELSEIKNCLKDIYPVNRTEFVLFEKKPKVSEPWYTMNHTVHIRDSSTAALWPKPQKCWGGKKPTHFYRPKFLPHVYDGDDHDVFPCADPMLLNVDSDFLPTKEEIPLIPGLKNPCYCTGDFAKFQKGVGLVK